MTKTILYFTGTHGDWGGASRVIFTIIRNIDKDKFKPIVMLSRRGPVCEDLDELGISYYFFKKHDISKNLIKGIFGILLCLIFYKKHKIDLIHLNYGCIGWYPSEIIAARILNIPIVQHVHIAEEIMSPFIKYSDIVIAVSEFVAKGLKHLCVPLKVIYNSVDLKRFGGGTDIRQRLGLSKNSIIISFHGQIRKIKGIEMFINLAKKIENQNTFFLMTGPIREFEDKYTEEDLKKLIGSDKRIRYLGYIDYLKDVYATTDIVIMPSQWEETFGLILIEAGANRKPVVATRVGGIPEVISRGKNGFLVEKDDLNSMVKYTELLVNDEVLRKKMGEKGRQVVETRFTKKPIKEIDDLYRRLAQ